MYEMPGAHSELISGNSLLSQAVGMLRPKLRFRFVVFCLKPLLFNTSISPPTSLII